MEVRRCFPSIQVRFSVPSSSDLTPIIFERISDWWSPRGLLLLTENDRGDVEVVENGVNQAHLFRLWPNNITLKNDCEKRVFWFAGRLPDIQGRDQCAAVSIGLQERLY